MKKITPFSKYIYFALLVGIAIVGGNIASMLFYKYQVIVNGILGALVIYTIIHPLLTSKTKFLKDKIDEHILFDFPRNIFGFVGIFFVSIIFYWALLNVFRAISFLSLGK